ncbi:MAG: N-acetylmuramoyl-L-alanine amidase family protein [Candidatus Rifleibacteriota bacterium]
MKRNKFVFLFIFLLVSASASALVLNPLKGVRILLDPGHGGADPGAVGPTGLKESETNLRVARYLKMLLQADGAEVFMTRDTDKYLSLSQRVQKARQLKPDLFVSIHHNASITPRKKNRSEIYYNALDSGLSKTAGTDMFDKLKSHGFGQNSIIVPGGFFVLRNNEAPAILTEGSYISIPEIEKGLKTGKELTNQAEALRRAIRKTFSKGPLKIKFLVADQPVEINTPFFNFIFTANKPIAKLKARMANSNTSFGFDLLPTVSNTYRLYNTESLQSGTYNLKLTFQANDGTVSPKINLPIKIELPLAGGAIKPVAPFIPEGFKGKFPVQIDLHDSEGSLNTRSTSIAVCYGDQGETILNTNEDGQSLALLDLTGKERGSLEIRLVHDSQIIENKWIKVKEPVNRFVIGKVTDRSGKGLKGVELDYGLKKIKTAVGGYFYLEYPMVYENLHLKIIPPAGYKKTTSWIKTKGEPVSFKNIRLTPVSQRLLGKKIGILAPRSFGNLLKEFESALTEAGAKVARLSMPETMRHPEYQAVLEANLADDFDLILSFKRENCGTINARHYHRGGKGKFIADSLAFSLKNSEHPVKLKVMAGSDYEISHTGATAVVIAFPQIIPPHYPQKVVRHLEKVLKTAF